MLVISSPEQIQIPTAIALGNFDGIHQGHQLVLRSIIKSSTIVQQPHIYSSVVSFTPHPREFFTGEKRQLLTPIAEKAELLAEMGIEQLILLPFDRDLASLTPQQFVEQILVQKLKAREVSVGLDFRFGYQRQGSATDLKNIAANFEIGVHLNSLHKYQASDQPNAIAAQGETVRVSSTLIRQALATGKIDLANKMLGRPYQFQGEVVTGKQLGRTIGFPTANLKLPTEKFLPKFGVYAVDVCIEGETGLKGVMNVGCRPTVAGESPTIEVHLLNWSGDLYGQTLKVDLLSFLRPEQKFASVEALKQQIAKDCQAVLKN